MTFSHSTTRVVAHELGHYLLQSRAHSATGLMKQDFTSDDMRRETREFLPDAAQIARIWELWSAGGTRTALALAPEAVPGADLEP